MLFRGVLTWLVYILWHDWGTLVIYYQALWASRVDGYNSLNICDYQSTCGAKHSWQVLARENRRLCSKFHILCFQTYTIFKAQAFLNIELGPKTIQFKIQFKTKSGILIPKRYSFKRVQNIQQNYSFTKNEGTCSTFQIEAKIWFEARPVINLAIFHGKYMQPGRR